MDPASALYMRTTARATARATVRATARKIRKRYEIQVNTKYDDAGVFGADTKNIARSALLGHTSVPRLRSRSGTLRL